MLFPLILPSFPVIILLFTTFPRPSIITALEASSLLFVKSLELILISPAPVVFPLFVMLFPEISSKLSPCKFPTRFRSWSVVRTVLFPFIVPVLSNFFAFCIETSPDKISPIFVMLELFSSILPFEAIFPEFETVALFEFMSFTASISFVFVKVFVVKSISFAEEIFPLFLVSLTLALMLSADILPVFVNSKPVISRFLPSIFPPLIIESEVVIFPFVARTPEFSSLCDVTSLPAAIFPIFLTFLTSSVPLVKIFPELLTLPPEIFPTAVISLVFSISAVFKSFPTSTFPSFFKLSVLRFLEYMLPEFWVSFPEISSFTAIFPVFLIFFETVRLFPDSKSPLFSSSPETVIFLFALTFPEVFKSFPDIDPTAWISPVFLIFLAFTFSFEEILPSLSKSSDSKFLAEIFPEVFKSSVDTSPAAEISPAFLTFLAFTFPSAKIFPSFSKSWDSKFLEIIFPFETTFLPEKSPFVAISLVFLTFPETFISSTASKSPSFSSFPETVTFLLDFMLPEVFKSFVEIFPADAILPVFVTFLAWRSSFVKISPSFLRSFTLKFLETIFPLETASFPDKFPPA